MKTNLNRYFLVDTENVEFVSGSFGNLLFKVAKIDDDDKLMLEMIYYFAIRCA